MDKTQVYLYRVFGTAWAVVIDKETGEPRNATPEEMVKIKEVYDRAIKHSIAEVSCIRSKIKD